MDWKELGKSIIKLGAPLLGSVVGGPAGSAIGGMVASLFGADPNDPADILAKISLDPQAAVKLQELQLNHKERLEELKIEEGKIALEETKAILADRQSARQRETAVVQATGKSDINLYLLAWTIVVGFFVLTGILMFKDCFSPQITGVVNLLFGGLVSGFATVLAYFFGSSKGSAEKTTLLAESAERASLISQNK